MKTIIIIWTIFNTLIACRLAFMLTFNPAFRLISGRRRTNHTNFSLMIMIAIYLIHFLAIFFVKVYSTNELMLLLSSFLFFHWSVIAKYMLEKYAPPVRKVGKLIESPLYLTYRVLISTISFGLSIVIFLSWYYIFSLIILWGIYGLICTEISIRKEMKFLKINRKDAIFSINHNLGRTWVKANRYPFP